MHSLKRFCATSVSKGPVKSPFEHFYDICKAFADVAVVVFHLHV